MFVRLASRLRFIILSSLFTIMLSFYLLLPLFSVPTNAETGITDFEYSESSASPFTEYTLAIPDLTAKFIPYGARLTSLLVPDRYGRIQDIVGGYDDPHDYVHDTETTHTYFGAIVGRYANRIKNGTFTVDGVTSHIPRNENNGADTLHGGFIGYDQRNWTVTAHNTSSITFSLLDMGLENFPGSVITHATFALSSVPGGAFGLPIPRLTTRLVSVALDQPTPIMLSNHIYWNLDAWQTPTVLNDTMWMPHAGRYIEIDSILVPTGDIATVSSRPTLDFTKPKKLGAQIQQANGVCGAGCTGYDTAFILDRPSGADSLPSTSSALSMWSDITGIKMDVRTNQNGLQIYSCNGLDGTIPVKESQQERNRQAQAKEASRFVEKYGCIAIEPQGWIDGVNNPQWGPSGYKIYGPDTGPAVAYSTYDFSTF